MTTSLYCSSIAFHCKSRIALEPQAALDGHLPRVQGHLTIGSWLCFDMNFIAFSKDVNLLGKSLNSLLLSAWHVSPSAF